MQIPTDTVELILRFIWKNLKKIWNGIWKIWIMQMTGHGLTVMEMHWVMRVCHRWQQKRKLRHFWKDDMPKENPDKMQVQETECQMEMVRMEMKCRVKSRTEYRIEMTQMEKSRMEHQPEACQVEKLRTAMLKMTWLQVEWEMRSELRMPELHSLQVQKQILQTTAVMKKCWNLMKVISPLSRMVTNTEIIL